MSGDLVIYWKDGWACSNQAFAETHKEFSRDVNGKILPIPARNISVFVAMDPYTVEGSINIDTPVECAAKIHDTGRTFSFRGMVSAVSQGRVIVKLTSELEDNVNYLTTKIKTSWQR